MNAGELFDGQVLGSMERRRRRSIIRMGKRMKKETWKVERYDWRWIERLFPKQKVVGSTPTWRAVLLCSTVRGRTEREKDCYESVSLSSMELGASSSALLNDSNPLCVGRSAKLPVFRALAALRASWNPLIQFSASAAQRGSCVCKAAVRSSSGSASLDKVMKLSEEASHESELFSLTALSPLDGRYRKKVEDLAPYLSEYGLIYFRVVVEIKWLLKLSEIPEVVEVPSFSSDARSYLEELICSFSVNDALEVKKIEKVTNHDVKAVEYFLKEKCLSHPEILKVLEFFHFACTSEDINNLAHALMLKEALNEVVVPVMDDMIKAICTMAKVNAHISMLSRTHGQPASPTTLGKEMAIFAVRLRRERHEISSVALLGKFAGAVGNYNAHLVAYPEINWPQISKEFVESLGLSFNPYVTQIETHDYMAKLFHGFIQFNNVLTDFDRDIWGYISLGYFKQITKAGEIGSSTMPHKVNPIDFENSEGNLGKANAGLSYLSMKLPISCWQRDLTDSTVLRNMGEVLGHSLLAYKSALQGIGKLRVSIKTYACYVHVTTYLSLWTDCAAYFFSNL
uniref:Adenylosuccinate lyase n=2 Tax=Kalanchoe fedtschenkoi TaxID=63787 RepID=A0A7N0THK9_KALFE